MNKNFLAGWKQKASNISSKSLSISASEMNDIIDRLRLKTNRESTKNNYLAVWRHFNKFLILLDNMPNLWEEHTGLFMAYLIKNGRQSATLKSYVSAIKAVLKYENYNWNEDQMLLTSLIRACKLQNNRWSARRPLSIRMVELIMFELDRSLGDQPFLKVVYQTMIMMGYYSLLRPGEMTKSPHAIKAQDVFIGQNKNKILLILRSSKTHSKESRPQKVKIMAHNYSIGSGMSSTKSCFCPFETARKYINM